MKNFFQVPYSLFETELSLNEVIVLCILSNMQGKKKEAYPKQEMLARLLKISERTIKRVLINLQSLKYINIIRVGNGRSNRYQLTDKSIATMELLTGQIVTSRGDNLSPEVDNLSPEVDNLSPLKCQIGLSEKQEPLNKIQLKEPTNKAAGQFFCFSERPDIDYAGDELTRRAMNWCISCCAPDLADMDAEEQWNVGWEKWVEIIQRGVTDREEDNIDYFLKKVKHGYKAKSLAHVICARLLK